MLAAPLGPGAFAFGVFDGHGGAHAAQLLAELMPGVLLPLADSGFQKV